MARTVIILGAGASHAEGAPLQKDLFLEYHRRAHSRGIAHDMDRELATFFEMFFGVDFDAPELNKTDLPTFEEVLGTIEIALQRGESFRGFECVPDNPRLQQTREHLIFLICEVLDQTLRGRARHHRKLIRNLASSASLFGTAFLSFNYDILIDNALTDAWQDCDLDYGTDFINFSMDDDWRRPDPDRAVPLLKLHGSLNWLYCPTCTALKLTPKQKSVVQLRHAPHLAEVCRCGSRFVPIIIPPTFFKVMSNFHLQQVWRRAEQVLMEADCLVFCGYSLPDADMHVRYLLKRVEVNSGNTPEVFVVNQHAGKDPQQAREEAQRYARYFRDPRRLHFRDLSFEQFCDGGMPALRGAKDLPFGAAAPA
jgi:hypothetical protein